MKIAIATNNPNKLREIRAILGGFFDEALSLADLGIDIDIEETGTTLTENALIGAPGVYSARYAGEEHDDKKNNALLLKNLEGKPRDAKFCSVIALCYPDGRELTAEGSVRGVILEEERGTGGFGYDPLFFSPELGKTFAEATPEQKNSVSHRSRALRAMLELLSSGR